MRRSTSGTTEFFIFIIVLALIFFVLESLNIVVNRIYIVIPFLIIWIAFKMFRSNRSN
ncbi:MAG: hypothetical protein ACTHW2_11365 [Tissierella sp.]|uniref:hypothetical protein n=1 Tax=Tissierella sp. TaxID=41274 RepID=UPI003F98F5FC